MICDATTRKIQALMSGAAATTNPTVVVDYEEGRRSVDIVPGCQVSNLNGVTPVDILDAPATLLQRKVLGVSIENIDTAPVTVTVRYNDNATLYRIVTATLAVGDTLHFTQDEGWSITDSAGNLKETGSSGTGRYIGTTVLTAGVSFTTGPTTNTIKTRIYAGGGGGGGTTIGGAGTGDGGGGGSAGGYAEMAFAVAPNTAYTYAIGAAGAAGAPGAAGGAGGNSTFSDGVTTVTAFGGPGGAGSAAAAADGAVTGGVPPAVSTNGDVNASGDPGDAALWSSAAASGHSGKGGSSPVGAGGVALVVQGAGLPGVGFNAGGSGGLTLANQAAVAGGAGLIGVIIVEEYS